MNGLARIELKRAAFFTENQGILEDFRRDCICHSDDSPVLFTDVVALAKAIAGNEVSMVMAVGYMNNTIVKLHIAEAMKKHDIAGQSALEKIPIKFRTLYMSFEDVRLSMKA